MEMGNPEVTDGRGNALQKQNGGRWSSEKLTTKKGIKIPDQHGVTKRNAEKKYREKEGPSRANAPRWPIDTARNTGG